MVATEWSNSDKNGRLGRVVAILAGMTRADGLRAIGGYPDGVYAYAQEQYREPLDVGSLLTLKW